MQNFLVAIGDSITNGNGSTPYTASITVPGDDVIQNRGASGQTLATMFSSVASYWPVGRSNNIAVLWGGTNDIVAGTTPANTFTILQNEVAALHALGYKVIVCTMLSRTSWDTQKNTYNALILANTNLWEATVDFSGTPLGIDGGSANGTWFVDGIHPTALGISTYEVPLIQAAINTLSLPINPQTNFKHQQSNSEKNTTSINGSNCPTSSPVSTNDLIVACAWWQGSAGLFTSFGDSQGNAWTLLGSLRAVGSFQLGVWYATKLKPSSATTTLQLVLSGPPTSNNAGIAFAEYSPPDNTVAALKTSSTFSGSVPAGGVITSGTVTPLAGDILCLLGFGANFGFTSTAGSGYTVRVSGANATFLEDNVNASAGAQTGSITNSQAGLGYNASLVDFTAQSSSTPNGAMLLGVGS